RVAVFSVEYPSGADDTVAFEMTTEGGVWKIASIHTSAEPVRRARLLPKLPPTRDVHEPLLIDQRIALALGLPATLLAMAGIALVPRRNAGRLLLGLATLAMAGATVAILAPRIHIAADPDLKPDEKPAAGPADAMPRLG